MRTLVIYESQSGNTKRYAEDIAKAVSADILCSLERNGVLKCPGIPLLDSEPGGG